MDGLICCRHSAVDVVGDASRDGARWSGENGARYVTAFITKYTVRCRLLVLNELWITVH